MRKLIETTRMLIEWCEDNEYSGQTQALIYSQIIGLGLELEIEIIIRDGQVSNASMSVAVASYLPMVVKGGFEPVPYQTCAFIQKWHVGRITSTCQWQWCSGYHPRHMAQTCPDQDLVVPKLHNQIKWSEKAQLAVKVNDALLHYSYVNT